MSEIYETGSLGERLLTEYLTRRGHTVSPSGRKTFDLIVDGRYADVKTSRAPYARLGFVGLTDAQHAALLAGEDFSVFVVCNAQDPSAPEVLEFTSSQLRGETPTAATTYYWYRSQLERIRSEGA